MSPVFKDCQSALCWCGLLHAVLQLLSWDQCKHPSGRAMQALFCQFQDCHCPKASFGRGRGGLHIRAAICCVESVSACMHPLLVQCVLFKTLQEALDGQGHFNNLQGKIATRCCLSQSQAVGGCINLHNLPLLQIASRCRAFRQVVAVPSRSAGAGCVALFRHRQVRPKFVRCKGLCCLLTVSKLHAHCSPGTEA